VRGPHSPAQGAGRLDRGQAIGQHGAQDGHHLAVTAGRLGELAAHPLERRRQQPGLERGAIPERARFARQHRHIVPGIVHGLAAAEDAAVLADDAAILARTAWKPSNRPA
jgi:thiamine monophosphate kinase